MGWSATSTAATTGMLADVRVVAQNTIIMINSTVRFVARLAQVLRV